MRFEQIPSTRVRILCALILVVWLWKLCNGQYYMYTPGESIVPYMKSTYDTYGAGLYCGSIWGANCSTSPYFDPTMCQYSPTNVSVTPYISYENLYRPPGTSASILVSCDAWTDDASLNISLYFTTNGTLPDITGPCHSNGVRCLRGALVAYGPNDPPPLIVARCVQQGMLPSRIAYAKRIPWDDEVNGLWCDAPHAIKALPSATYRELSLPRCNHISFGALCDGQTIVAGAQLPIPPDPTAPGSDDSGKSHRLTPLISFALLPLYFWHVLFC